MIHEIHNITIGLSYTDEYYNLTSFMMIEYNYVFHVTHLKIKRTKRLSYSLDLHRGSRGPSTVTFIALPYVATCGGLVEIVIVIVKLLPEKIVFNNRLVSKVSLTKSINILV